MENSPSRKLVKMFSPARYIRSVQFARSYKTPIRCLNYQKQSAPKIMAVFSQKTTFLEENNFVLNERIKNDILIEE